MNTVIAKQPNFIFEEFDRIVAAFPKPKFVHMELTKVTVFGERKIALCGCENVELTDDKKKVNCPKCKQIIRQVKKNRKDARTV